MSEGASPKAAGVVYTPAVLADFMAELLLNALPAARPERALRVLDPAAGEGALLAAMQRALKARGIAAGFILTGQDIDEGALARARECGAGGEHTPQFIAHDFLSPGATLAPDLIIANPPYVRTQHLEPGLVASLREQFGLRGRLDLGSAFLLQILRVLADDGLAVVVVSNRFMSVKAGERVRALLRRHVRGVWDLGDTGVFEDAAVLPAVLLLGKRARGEGEEVPFLSVYETNPAIPVAQGLPRMAHPLEALTSCAGEVLCHGDRAVVVRRAALAEDAQPGAIWRGVTAGEQAWLERVREHTWRTFGEVAKIKVGVKSCADRVFIKEEWGEPAPELLQPLLTHHVARRFAAQPVTRHMLYPHLPGEEGSREVANLEDFPRAAAYLAQHRERLEGRAYLKAAGRQWHELWVPQDPGAWSEPKLVWRDIAPQATFFVDATGALVNGDCYWMRPDEEYGEPILWLALAVANSALMHRFYDLRFNNRLYGGRRRYITQYVERFPLPDPEHASAATLMELARAAWESGGGEVDQELLDACVERAFGL